MNKKPNQILIIERKGKTVHLILNRPSVLNALNKPLLLEIKNELEKIKVNPDIQAIFIYGAEDKAFSAGADIEYLSQATPLQVREFAQLAISVNNLIETLNIVSIALINGFALGGGLELAESCMFRIAVPSAKFGHPEVRIGAVAGWGGTTRLPRLVGKSQATEMLLTGKMINAEDALLMGLVNRVTSQESLISVGEKLLEEILNNSPIAVKLTWEALHRGLDLPIEESTKLGADFFGLAASSQDFRDGTESFLKKLPVNFKGV